MNIDLRFQDWSLALAPASVRQYDDRAQTIRVTGDIPEHFSWKMYVSVYGDTYFNSIPLAEADGALSALLRRDDLAFGDTTYLLQLVGSQGDVTRHTNVVRLYVDASLSGDGVWPEIPRSFTDAEQTALAAAETAVQAGGAAMARLDRLATFGEGSGETIEVPDYTNQIPVSTDAAGGVFNGTGFKTGWRFNSSGEEVAETNVSVTGFIPAARDSVLRFRDIGLYVEAATGVTLNRIYLCCYDASKTFLNAAQIYKVCEHTPAAATITDGRVTALDLSKTDQSAYGVPSGTAYVRFSAYEVTGASIITVDEEIKTREIPAPAADGVALLPEVSVPLAERNAQRLSALETAVSAIPDPEDPLVRYADQIDRAQTIGYAPVLTNRPTAGLVEKKTLNFLHVSDTHGSVNLDRAVRVLNHLAANGRCACMVHTGDLHASTFASDYAPVQAALDAAQAPVLLVTGNHDVGNNQKTTDDTATDAQLYERMFAPVIDRWDATNHPAGKCYWYKDFADAGVRLIGLHDFESDYDVDPETGLLLYKRGFAAYHQEQIDWFVEALMTCPAGYGVIIAKHNPVNLRGGLDNPFNGEFLRGQNTGQTYVSNNIIPAIVKAFMDGTAMYATFPQTQGVVTTLTVQQSFARKNPGAHFICYLDGHTHADGVSFLQDYPKQLELNIGCDNFHYQHYSDTLNQQDTLHQDLMNYVSVDVNRGYVYIQRIGNDFTAQADRRDYTAIDYRHPPVAVSFPEITAADEGKVWGVSGGAWGLVAAPTPAEPVLEPIRTYTCDGTETTNGTFFLDADDNGDPFRLKKLVLRVKLGSVSAAGIFSANVMNGTSKTLAQAYGSYTASASGHLYKLHVYQDCGYWAMMQYLFGAATASLSVTHTYCYADPAADYPYIDRVRLTRTVPAGTVIELLGVRA